MFRRAAWGVDLTGGAVHAVHVERIGDDYRVVDFVEQPYAEAGLASEPLRAHLPDGCDRALHGLLHGRRAATLGDPVFVALPTFGARHGFIELAVADAQRTTALFDFELHQQLGEDLSPWLVRVAPFQSVERGLVAPYFAQRRELVASFLNDVRRVGLPVDGLVAGPLALARYARSEWPATGCQLVLQVQRTRTDFVYVTPQRTRFRSVPLGCGLLKEPEFLPRDPQKTFDELAGRLVREHESARRALFGEKDGTTVARVLLLGDGARHPALRAALAEQFHVEVVVPHFGHRVAYPAARTGEEMARALAQGTALGLALGALETGGEIHSLLRPPADRRARRALPALTAALLLIASGLLLLRLLVTHAVATDEEELAHAKESVQWGAQDDLDEAVAAAQGDAARVHELIAKAAALRRELAFPTRLLEALHSQKLSARLTALELVPVGDHDEATVELEIPSATPGALDRLADHVQQRTGAKLISSEPKGVVDDVLGAVLHLRIGSPEDAP